MLLKSIALVEGASEGSLTHSLWNCELDGVRSSRNGMAAMFQFESVKLSARLSVCLSDCLADWLAG